MHEKKRYLKPELVQVPLRPEEAVLTACKQRGGGQAGYSTPCNAGVDCLALGS